MIFLMKLQKSSASAGMQKKIISGQHGRELKSQCAAIMRGVNVRGSRKGKKEAK